MTLFHAIRLYHAALAILATLAYLTGEAGLIHEWLGYAVAGVIAFRLAWSVAGPRQLGIARFFPSLAELKAVRWISNPAVGKALLFGLIASLLLTTGTGLLIAGEAREVALVPPALADGGHGDGKGEDFVEELHEAVAELFLIFAIAHAAHMILFRRKLAFAMWFMNRTAARR